MWGEPASSVRLGGSWAFTPERPTMLFSESQRSRVRGTCYPGLAGMGSWSKIQSLGLGWQWILMLTATSHQAISVCQLHAKRSTCSRKRQERSSGMECQGPTLHLWDLEESLPHLTLGSALTGSINWNPHSTLWVKVLVSPSSSHFTDGHVEDGRSSTTSPNPAGIEWAGSDLTQVYLQRLIIKLFIIYPLWRKCVNMPIHQNYLFIYKLCKLL